MTRADIILRVKARMDELNPFTGEELNPSISLIDNLLDESVTTILSFIPLYLIHPEEFPVTSLTQTDRTGYVNLPTDFLRLHSFKMAGWETEVTEAITPQHPKYKLQKNAVTMGGKNKPVVVIKSESGKSYKVLYYYSLEDGDTHTVEQSLYIKNVVPDATSSTVQDDLVDFIAWQCASDVFLAMEEVNASNAAKQKLSDLINIRTY